MNARVVLFMAAVLGFAMPATAQQLGGYIGASATASRASNLSAGEVNDFLAQAGYRNPSTSVDRKDSGFKVFGGYAFTPQLAIELAETDIGEFSTRTTVTGGSVDASYRAKATSLDAVLSAPVNDALSVFGRLGLARTRTDARFASTGIVGLQFTQAERKKTAPHFGIGLQYALAKEWAIRAELERFAKLGDDSTGGELRTATYSLGAVYRF